MQRVALGASAWMVLSLLSAIAATPDQLYQTWQSNNLKRPEIAEKAAQDYLHAAPMGPYAHDLQIWLDAYHKAMASLGAAASQAAGKSAAKDARAAVMPVPSVHAQTAPGKTAASGENKAPPKQPQKSPPSMASTGPSLEETLAFIRDKIAGQGKIAFTAQFRKSASDPGFAKQLSYQASKLTMDRNRCQLSFRWHVEEDGKSAPDQDRAVPFHRAEGIKVETLDQALSDLNASAGLSVSARPGGYAVHLARKDHGSSINLYFRDENTANQVAKAAQHALELCSDGAGDNVRGSLRP